jgi:hypothetical protein
MTMAERILVVVDPASATQPVVGRAARVAASMRWGLELFTCIHDGLPGRIPKAADGSVVRRPLLAHQPPCDGLVVKQARLKRPVTCRPQAPDCMELS